MMSPVTSKKENVCVNSKIANEKKSKKTLYPLNENVSNFNNSLKHDGDHRPSSDNYLKQLNQSPHDLLNYYRRKVDLLTDDHELVQRRLDKIVDTICAQEMLSLELGQREAEIVELQKALSDMQVVLFQEREHVLRLYAENDRLKIREQDDRRKIQYLLQLSNLGTAEITYFLKEPNMVSMVSGSKNETRQNSNDNWISAVAVKPIIPTEPVQGIVELTASGKSVRKTYQNDQNPSSTKLKHNTNNQPCTVSSAEHDAALREVEATRATLKSLHTQLEEQARNAREQIDSLMEDRKTMQEEIQTIQKRCEAKVRSANEQLKRCQELLLESTKEFLAQRNQFRQAEKVWIVEKEKLVNQLNTHKSVITTTAHSANLSGPINTDQNMTCILENIRSNKLDMTTDFNSNLEPKAWLEVLEQRNEQYKKSIQNLEYQMEQQQNLAEMYREQVIQLEDELVRTREEGVLSQDIFKDRAHKLRERLESMSTRYQNLERRRQLEMEGYRTDIATLRKKLRDVERQLLKLTLGLKSDEVKLGNLPQNVDLALLKEVKGSTSRSIQIMNELKTLKMKMYSLENEMHKL